MQIKQCVWVFVFLPTLLLGQAHTLNKRSSTVHLLPKTVSILNSITASNLKGNLSFLSSDLLQGRYTPSSGLDIAAEFIASQFRAASLEPGGNKDYFQTVAMVDRQVPAATSSMTAESNSQSFSIPPQSITVFNSSANTQIQHCPVLVFKTKDPEKLKGVDLKGKAVVAPNLSLASVPETQREQLSSKSRAFDDAVAASHAEVEILIGRSGRGGRSRLLAEEQTERDKVPVVIVDNEDLKRWLDHPTNSPDGRRISFDVPAPHDNKVVLKNIVGVLRGSDQKLKNTCVLLTAHYDHIGNSETGRAMSPQVAKDTDDHIYNGANDDGSGTVSVIEIARAFAHFNLHPKRSIVFVAFFGEERGDIGSDYYGKHATFPVAKTIADINLEQMGRTDSTEGRQLNNFSITGFDYSDVTTYLQNAGRQLGITVYLNKEASDAYFVRSDNAALAEQGVPAHTLCVAFDYPDYHGVGDEWQKIDYENMAKVDRTVALAVLNMANSVKVPQWNVNNPKTVSFREARNKLLSQQVSQ